MIQRHMSHKMRATFFIQKTTAPLGNTSTGYELYPKERQQTYKFNFNTDFTY